ncbi:MAG: hypothetical protein E4G90_00325 [Gemmatimonadales bacterium]|nr:MAG: hypothetical protein E4G90_00325 [Gemmatimonadales bacterium]
MDEGSGREEFPIVLDSEHMGALSKRRAAENDAPLGKPDCPEGQLQAVLDALPEDGTLLEYGSGASTVWFANRLLPNQHLVSVEHDETWYWKAANQVPNWEQTKMLFCPATTKQFVELQAGHPARECPVGLSRYIGAHVDIDEDSAVLDADVIFVDGVARGACLAVAAASAKEGCIVFLHDAQRNWYGWASALFILIASIPSPQGGSQLLCKYRLRR